MHTKNSNRRWRMNKVQSGKVHSLPFSSGIGKNIAFTFESRNNFRDSHQIVALSQSETMR